MNIHEIIHAWHTHALPDHLDALAAMQNKVEDYRNEAVIWRKKATTDIVQQHYLDQYVLFNWIVTDVENKIQMLIPDPKKGATVP